MGTGNIRKAKRSDSQNLSRLAISLGYDYFSKKHIGRVIIYKRRDVYDEHNNLIEIWDDADDKLVEKRFYRFVYNSKES
jgi:hypothetical protein